MKNVLAVTMTENSETVKPGVSYWTTRNGVLGTAHINKKTGLEVNFLPLSRVVLAYTPAQQSATKEEAEVVREVVASVEVVLVPVKGSGLPPVRLTPTEPVEFVVERTNGHNVKLTITRAVTAYKGVRCEATVVGKWKEVGSFLGSYEFFSSRETFVAHEEAKRAQKAARLAGYKARCAEAETMTAREVISRAHPVFSHLRHEKKGVHERAANRTLRSLLLSFGFTEQELTNNGAEIRACFPEWMLNTETLRQVLLAERPAK